MTTANDTGRFEWIALAEQWIRYARSDLRAAERLLDDDLVLYGVPCFHVPSRRLRRHSRLFGFFTGLTFPRLTIWYSFPACYPVRFPVCLVIES